MPDDKYGKPPMRIAPRAFYSHIAYSVLQLIELGESLHAIFVVDDATGFAATVHSEDGC